jgi:hypothetical protein
MNSYHLLVAISAIAAYGVSSAIQVELRDGRRMTAVGAFGPALVALGGNGYDVAPLVWLVCGALCVELVALLASRQRVRMLLPHGIALFVAAGVFAVIGLQHWINGRPALLLGTALSSLVYLGIGGFHGNVDSGSAPAGRMRDRLVTAAPVHAVLVSTAGLTVLALPFLRWATFPIVLVPLLATAHEFAHFGQTRRTFDETVRALASLVEGSGYAPAGHHERVASMCVAMAREVGLSSKQTRELELVALLHDVGAVSFSEPEVLAVTDPAAVAERSAAFVEETGYLAGYGETVREAAAHVVPLSIEASILRAANVWDEVNSDRNGNSGPLESTVETIDPQLARILGDLDSTDRSGP